MSLGAYPEVSLREARLARNESRALLAAQINPQRERKRRRQTADLAEKHSFQLIF
ncbi:integrase arm-type DNA-binding domain-containing protein [Pseudomonas sp. LRF_L74]|uniref:integrase arm-type DNA-binding domain-containing protein n=1 Tax=Pseudomonas sp. LRF_L74 TaxID=3369422 RepID=UPI003F63A595